MHGAQENTDHILMPGELESWNVEEGDEMVEEAFDFPTWTSESGGRFLVNVDSFGAVGDGISDDTQVSSCANLKIFMFIWVSVAQRKKYWVVLVILKLIVRFWIVERIWSLAYKLSHVTNLKVDPARHKWPLCM